MYQSNRNNVTRAIRAAEQRALEKIGLFVEGEAKLRCTVDTGNLRNSIDHKVNDSEKCVTIGTNVEYAVFVEMGTYKMKEQPFLTPAAEENKDKIKQIVEAEFRNI